jgi:hypothetical protein
MSEVTVVARIHPKAGKEDEVARLLVQMAGTRTSFRSRGRRSSRTAPTCI